MNSRGRKPTEPATTWQEPRQGRQKGLDREQSKQLARDEPAPHIRLSANPRLTPWATLFRTFRCDFSPVSNSNWERRTYISKPKPILGSI
jgi:hypothetical protein